MLSYRVVELLGDGIGPELSKAVHFLAERALPFGIDWQPVDLSVENRNARGAALYDEAVAAIESATVALKHRLIGSLGIGASGSYGFDSARGRAEGASASTRRVRVALFDPAHGTAPDIAGQGKANPTACFLAFALLLYHKGEVKAGSAVKNSCLELLREGTCTGDVGGKLSTMEFANAVALRVRQKIADPTWTLRTLKLHKEKI
jgi:isocitrate/isopropylmalate dehydrogenase